MKFIVDRIEADVATVELEDGRMLNIPTVLIAEAEEGDIVEIIVRKEATKERENYIENLKNNLFE